MKKVVVYSSKTGNTKMLAEVAAKTLGDCDLLDVTTSPNVDDYDFVAIGWWIDKGTADKDTLDWLVNLKGKKVFYFMTLGAYPDSDHGKKCVENGRELLAENEILGSFICQGKIAPHLKEWMTKLDKSHPHYPDEARLKRWADADSHPDEQDLENLRIKLESVLNK